MEMLEKLAGKKTKRSNKTRKMILKNVVCSAGELFQLSIKIMLAKYDLKIYISLNITAN